jgi:hypothetical protein
MARPSISQSAAVAARLGQGLPPATVAGEPVDPTGPPLCPNCGRQHETPGELRRPAMARSLLAGPGDSTAILRDRGARPPGWGRDRGGSCWP